MIIFAVLFLLGLAISMIGLSYLIRAIRSRDARRIALALGLPALYWLVFLGLFAADRRYVAQYNREHPGSTLE